MTLFARLTWQVAEPDAFARQLGARLGVGVAAAGGLAAGSSVLDLGSALLEVRPWVSEGPEDRPSPSGRLMLEPVPGGEPAPDESREDADRGASSRVRLAGIGWATVELDRAEEELAPWLGEGIAGDLAEPHLGAAARVRSADGLPGDAFVLLQPTTEGRLAGSLARDGEGPCALYLRPPSGLAAWARDARSRGEHLSVRLAGPLGTEVLLVGGPVAGPHLLLIDTPRVSNRADGAGTIGR
jgi:hypothetical protein